MNTKVSMYSKYAYSKRFKVYSKIFSDIPDSNDDEEEAKFISNLLMNKSLNVRAPNDILNAVFVMVHTFLNRIEFLQPIKPFIRSI